MATSELRALLGKITELFDAEYQRGEAAAIARYERALAAVRDGDTVSTPRRSAPRKSRSDSQRNRVGRGVPEAFVKRVLTKMFPDGVTPMEIVGQAESPEEKAVSYSAVRTTVHRGGEERWAAYRNGKWFYVAEEEPL